MDKNFVSRVYSYVYQLVSDVLTTPQKDFGIKLLDFGAGTGSMCQFIKYNGIDSKYGIEFYAVDINPKYENKSIAPYSKYTLIKNGEGMMYPNRFFDVIVSLYVFHYSIPAAHIQ